MVILFVSSKERHSCTFYDIHGDIMTLISLKPFINLRNIFIPVVSKHSINKKKKHCGQQKEKQFNVHVYH